MCDVNNESMNKVKVKFLLCIIVMPWRHMKVRSTLSYLHL